MYYYKINIHSKTQGKNCSWPGSRLCLKKNLKSFSWFKHLKSKNAKKPFWKIFKEKSIQLIDNGGWHFNYLLEPEKISTKLKTFAHTQYNKDEFTNIDVIKKNIDEMSSGLDDLENEIQKVYQRIGEIAKSNQEIQKEEMQINQKNSNVQAHNSFVTKLSSDLEEMQKEMKTDAIHVLTKELDESKSTRLKYVEQKFYYDILSTILNDTGIKTRIIRKYLPVINKHVNNYLKDMDFFVNFQLDENFQETIKSRHRDDFSYYSFSEGEKKRIDIALLLTWRDIASMRNSVNVNLLILDEVFDASLDQAGMDDLLKLFKILKSTNLFIISHKLDILDDKFPKRILVEKIKNFTQMVYE